LYYANWLHVLIGPDKMGGLAHTWSLSIEEQFYLAWPLVLGLVLRIRQRTVRECLVAALVAALFFARMLLHAGASPLAAYGSTLARIDEILVGALIAMCTRPDSNFRVSSSVAWVCAAALCAATFWADIDQPWLYLRGFTAIALAAALVILHVTRSPSMLTGRMLSWRPLVELGKRPYGIYLFHLPVVIAP
jgi:peptidoglycan/LPS O-acetylase OafA/YrhL